MEASTHDQQDGSRISALTRRDLFDALRIDKVPWHGRLDEIDFLKRLYELRKLRSTDERFRNAEDDIFQHRVRNNDWDDDWAYTDSRFGLLDGKDDVLLRFLCEMIHPLVRSDPEEVERLRSLFNARLAADGWEIAEGSRLSGRPLFVPRPLLAPHSHGIREARAVAERVSGEYIASQVSRLQGAVETDPELAIGTAKEFVETVAKSILEQRGIAVDRNWDVAQVVKAAMKELRLAPELVNSSAKEAPHI